MKIRFLGLEKANGMVQIGGRIFIRLIMWLKIKEGDY